MGAIRIHNVVKRYGKGPKANQVIHGVSAEINDGEFIVIVGPSGCGKSTLLRMVAGLEEISEGEISIGGRVVNDVEPADRDIAMVFQNYALYPHMSVYDNMAYGLKIAKVPKAEIEARVQKAAKILEIGPFLQRTPLPDEQLRAIVPLVIRNDGDSVQSPDALPLQLREEQLRACRQHLIACPQRLRVGNDGRMHEIPRSANKASQP